MGCGVSKDGRLLIGSSGQAIKQHDANLEIWTVHKKIPFNEKYRDKRHQMFIDKDGMLADCKDYRGVQIIPKTPPLAPDFQEANAAACATLVAQATEGMQSIEVVLAGQSVRLYSKDPGPKLNELLVAAKLRFNDPEFDTSVKWDFKGRQGTPGICNPATYERVCSVDNERKTTWSETVGQYIFGDFQPHWLRISEPQKFWYAQGTAPVLFDSSVSMHDVNQGNLRSLSGVGNCWLCAQFSCIAAAVPDALKTTFSPSTISLAGCYSMRIFIDGVAHYLLLDDRVPCSNEGAPGDTFSIGSKNLDEVRFTAAPLPHMPVRIHTRRVRIA